MIPNCDTSWTILLHAWRWFVNLVSYRPLRILDRTSFQYCGLPEVMELFLASIRNDCADCRSLDSVGACNSPVQIETGEFGVIISVIGYMTVISLMGWSVIMSS
ncbi:hypothetical protein MPH61_18300 [Peribacillus muralis]|uniref:hypothetical protein n=1 Tax=Peribacillus muralis TaxID=264697 RepID=UPI001F4E8EE3|nr:hypothetical protein [Peribacillus muralis]MCK1994668.1 hypothetical protein [Peribacillus muralis]MCK2015097.1 hypothetical protein [Peribacillus muralis]